MTETILDTLDQQLVEGRARLGQALLPRPQGEAEPGRGVALLDGGRAATVLLAVRQAALDAIDAAWAQRRVFPGTLVVVRSLLGDIDGAMEVARLLEGPGMVFSMEVLFIPELAPLRQHPDFLPLLQRLGVVEYWDAVGCTWADDRVQCQD